MPARRRIDRRQLGDAAELVAWASNFACGREDLLGDLDRLGLAGSARDGSPANQAANRAWVLEQHAAGLLAYRLPTADEEAAAREVYDRCREAWSRLGARFLATWEPTEAVPECWALAEFGRPRGRHA